MLTSPNNKYVTGGKDKFTFIMKRASTRME